MAISQSSPPYQSSLCLPASFDLLLVNGAAPNAELLRHCAQAAQRLWCTDGSAQTALAAGLAPQFVVGDLDSLPSAVRESLQGIDVRERKSQDLTDLQKTLAELHAVEVRNVVVVGWAGGRSDHMINNLQILQAASQQFQQFVVVDDFGQGCFLNGHERNCPEHKRHSFSSFCGQQVSILSFSGARAVSSEGLRWELSKAELDWRGLQSISNEALGDSFQLQLEQGAVFVYQVFSRKEVPL